MVTRKPPLDAHDQLYLWFLADPRHPEFIGTLNLINPGNGVSLHYAQSWLKSGVPLSEDLPLVDTEYLPRAKDCAVGAVDDYSLACCLRLQPGAAPTVAALVDQ